MPFLKIYNPEELKKISRKSILADNTIFTFVGFFLEKIAWRLLTSILYYFFYLCSIDQKYVLISNGFKVENQFCSSIPLTEPRLIELGFKIQTKGIGYLQACIGENPITHDSMLILSHTGDGWFYNNLYFRIDSVHQLQNLYFVLTGEELLF